MAARSKARKRAVDILFEADQRGTDPTEVLARRRDDGDEPANPYTVVLVEGVAGHQAEIDAAISAHAHGWSLERMPAVDRAVLRLGVYEVRFGTDVPTAVAIDEAVQLAKDLSTDESPAFVNGVLGAVAADAPDADEGAPIIEPDSR